MTIILFDITVQSLVRLLIINNELYWYQNKITKLIYIIKKQHER
jgi:hypothetical protein